MPERTQAVEAYVTHLACKCGGQMDFTGREFSVQPPKFEYQCKVCKLKEIVAVRYPFISYKPKAETVEVDPQELDHRIQQLMAQRKRRR